MNETTLERYAETRYPDESLDAWMLRTNSHAYAQALDMIATLDSGALFRGLNCENCVDCGLQIPWVDFDRDGPDVFQPDGFRCNDDHWVCNECGDRVNGICNGVCCVACEARMTRSMISDVAALLALGALTFVGALWALG